jgi:hypothetical protein
VTARRVLRWAPFALTVAVVAVLTPYTVADSGAAAGYLLGVPLVAAVLPVLADLAGRGVLAAEAVGAAVMTVWGLLLALGIGGYFLPLALLLLVAFCVELTSVERAA